MLLILSAIALDAVDTIGDSSMLLILSVIALDAVDTIGDSS